MSPIEITRPSNKTRRIRFVRNKCYAGTDYGPAYEQDTVDVREDWAKYFVARGDAVYVTGDEGEKAPASSQKKQAGDGGEGDALEGVPFASGPAEKLARDEKLAAADFKGVEPSGESGYTKPDVDDVVEAKAAKDGGD